MSIPIGLANIHVEIECPKCEQRNEVESASRVTNLYCPHCGVWYEPSDQLRELMVRMGALNDWE